MKLISIIIMENWARNMLLFTIIIPVLQNGQLWNVLQLFVKNHKRFSHNKTSSKCQKCWNVYINKSTGSSKVTWIFLIDKTLLWTDLNKSGLVSKSMSPKGDSTLVNYQYMTKFGSLAFRLNSHFIKRLDRQWSQS